MKRQPFLAIVSLLKRALTAQSQLFSSLLGVLAILVLVPAVAAHEPWDKQLPANDRFVVLPAFDKKAVLDKETALVWEQSPDTTAQEWAPARRTCANKNVGGRKGWRLPAFAELASLIDPKQSILALPPGHPFSNVQSAYYWSAATLEVKPAEAWVVGLGNGVVGGSSKTKANLVWCVRGGVNADQH